MRAGLVAAWCCVALCAAMSPPEWDFSLVASGHTATYLAGGGGAMKGQVWLWWDVASQAFRVDQRTGDSQLLASTLVQFATRQAFVTSPNSSSLCSVFCLPPRVSSLPVLRVAGNDTRGVTVSLGRGRWLRTTDVGPQLPRHGQYNASVVTQTLSDGTPQHVSANYTLYGAEVAQHSCSLASFEPSRIDPALLLPPAACRGMQPVRCFAPMALYDPFPVAQGCFFAEAMAPFGTPPDDECSCN